MLMEEMLCTSKELGKRENEQGNHCIKHTKICVCSPNIFLHEDKKGRYVLYPIIGQYWPLFMHRDGGASSLLKTHTCEQQY